MAVMGSMWLLQGLYGCYGINVAVTGSRSCSFLRKSPFVALAEQIYVTVTMALLPLDNEC